MPQDLPDGQYSHLEKSGKKAKANPLRELGTGLVNYRMYGLAACYAFSFGVEVRSEAAPQSSIWCCIVACVNV